jgi:hypothetical protein
MFNLGKIVLLFMSFFFKKEEKTKRKATKTKKVWETIAEVDFKDGRIVPPKVKQFTGMNRKDDSVNAYYYNESLTLTTNF